jgi:hypothetical protein
MEKKKKMMMMVMMIQNNAGSFCFASYNKQGTFTRTRRRRRRGMNVTKVCLRKKKTSTQSGFHKI